MKMNEVIDLGILGFGSEYGSAEEKGTEYRNQLAQRISEYLGCTYQKETFSVYPILRLESEHRLIVRPASFECQNRLNSLIFLFRFMIR